MDKEENIIYLMNIVSDLTIGLSEINKRMEGCPEDTHLQVEILCKDFECAVKSILLTAYCGDTEECENNIATLYRRPLKMLEEFIKEYRGVCKKASEKSSKNN